MKSITTIIVGGGPSALQLGYFLQKNNQEYVILEKNNIAGSFFDKFPHSSELISINKRFTGSDNKEFNLRHDWNSLLSNKISMKDYSDKYFPNRDELVTYLNDFAKVHKLNIQYNTSVIKISKHNEQFRVLCNNGEWMCEKLVIATGLSEMNLPNIKNADKYTTHYGEFPKDYFRNDQNLEKYKNKKVLILGNGNSAFELANILNNYCSHIVVLGLDKTPRLSLSTHYVGNVRSKYLDFYDTFLLKSLNAFDHVSSKDDLLIYKQNDKFNIGVLCNSCNDPNPEIPCINYGGRTSIWYDEIINCTGWKFNTSIFDETTMPLMYNKKYPKLNGLYESINVKNMFFIGALMHSFDWKRSSGGFIHGFRYLIDNFVKINYTRFQPKVFENINELTQYFMERINTSSGLYQMYTQLGDYFYEYQGKYIYYEQVPLSYLFTDYNTGIYIPRKHVCILTLEYGDISKDLDKIGTPLNILLHPVIRIFNNSNGDFLYGDSFYPSQDNYSEQPTFYDEYHFKDNLLAEFGDNIEYEEKFKRLINGLSIL